MTSFDAVVLTAPYKCWSSSTFDRSKASFSELKNDDFREMSFLLLHDLLHGGLCHDRGDGELCRGACVVARCSCGGPTPANQALTDMTRQDSIVVRTQMTNNRIKALPTTHPELLRRFLYQMIGNFKITTKPNSFQ